MRLKTPSDELGDLDFKVSYKLLLSMLTVGLDEDLSNAGSNLILLTMLCLPSPRGGTTK